MKVTAKDILKANRYGLNNPNENMKIWDKVKQPPKEAMKKITGGRLNGMSSIDPAWRLMALTEVFGPCGFGWKYVITRQWEKEAGAEMSAHVNVDLFVKVDGEWSDAIPGTGGSMLLAAESKGYHHSDEAYKMALTDALSVACKALGFAADVYLGKFDGTKYNETGADKLQEPGPMTAAQIEELRRWVGLFQAIGEQKNASFINGNLMSWNHDTARIWLIKFNADYEDAKTW